MPETLTFTIKTETGRLDKVLSQLMPDESRSQIKQAIENQLVLVNQQTAKPSTKSCLAIKLS